MTVTKRKAGRPKIEGKRRVTLILTEDTITKAKMIGKGKLSPGVRTAIDAHATKNRPA